MSSLMMKHVFLMKLSPPALAKQPETSLILSTLNCVTMALGQPLVLREIRETLDDKLKAWLKQLILMPNFIKHSFEFIRLILMIAKNYPDLLQELKEYIMPLLSDLFDSGDKKKVLSLSKILEEWIKQYKQLELDSKNRTMMDEEDDLQQDEEVKQPEF